MPTSGAATGFRYTGPTTIAPGATLTAETPTDPRIAAVTFRLDNAPVATDAVPPYSVRFLAGDAAVGKRRVVVEIVYRSGERRRSPAAMVKVINRTDPSFRVVRSGNELHSLAQDLARGDIRVRLLPGRYDIRHLHLGPRVTFLGSGRTTVLATPTDDYAAGLVVTGTDVTVANLSIDGGGPGSGAGTGWAIEVRPGASRITLRRLDIRRTRTTGVYAWGKVSEVTVQDVTIDGGGTADAGVIVRLPEANDMSVIRTRVTRMRKFGILFAQLGHDNTKTGLRSLALDNVVTDINEAEDTQGRTKWGIGSGGASATIIGNTVRRAGWDGIETVGSSFDASIARNVITDTKVGIYLEHSTNRSSITRNSITDVETGITVEWFYAGAGSADNRFIDNTITHAKVGLFVDYLSDRNLIQGNVFSYGMRPAIVLQGASDNIVVENTTCGAVGELVHVKAALPETGPSVMGERNLVDRNTNRATCD